MRASVAAERAGIHSVSIITKGFVSMARAAARGLGVDDIAIAEFPGVIMTQSEDEFRALVREALVPELLTGLRIGAHSVARAHVSHAPRDIVIRGTLDEVAEAFIARAWSDGLPVMPPTLSRIDAFLSFTDRNPDEVLGTLLPANGEATVFSVAVNGVMAGCRPEYMPILVAAVEAICDPAFRIQDAGSTPGWEPLVIVSGPLARELNFNSGAGVLRVGRQANSTVGRFLRLYMRNVAGLRISPESTDKATIGMSFNVALAEDEEACEQVGWPTYSVERGFARDESVVTVLSVIGISPPTYTAGHTAEEHVRTLTEVIGQGWAYWSWSGLMWGQFHPLLVVSPSVAKIIARSQWTKSDIRDAFAREVKISADRVERYAWATGLTDFSLTKLASEGRISAEYVSSVDPNRLVPAFPNPQQIGIVVAGDEDRNQSRGYLQNHEQAPPISRRVQLPRTWNSRRRATSL